MQVHQENLHAMLEYHDLDLVFKVMEAILFDVKIVSAQYLEKQLA